MSALLVSDRAWAVECLCAQYSRRLRATQLYHRHPWRAKRTQSACGGSRLLGWRREE